MGLVVLLVPNRQVEAKVNSRFWQHLGGVGSKENAQTKCLCGEIMRKLSQVVGGALILTALVLAFIAYFVSSVDPVSHQWFDGLGRPLSGSPWFMRFVFGQDRQWAGWFWFLADQVMFWGGIAIGVALLGYSGSTNRDHANS